MKGFHSIGLRILAAVLLVAILAAGGFMVYQAGMAHGYAVGTLAGGQESGVTAPYHPLATGYGFYPFFPASGLFLCGGFLLMLFFLGAALRWLAWGCRPAGFNHPYGHGHWHHGYGWWGYPGGQEPPKAGGPAEPPSSPTGQPQA